MNVPQKSQQK